MNFLAILISPKLACRHRQLGYRSLHETIESCHSCWRVNHSVRCSAQDHPS